MLRVGEKIDLLRRVRKSLKMKKEKEKKEKSSEKKFANKK
jgi:hypothetical protein